MPRRSAARLPRLVIAFLVLALAPGLGLPAPRALSQGTGSTPLAWGFNDRGQLGDNTTTGRAQPAPPLNLSGVTAVAGGGEHTLALKSDGTVWTWGSNEFGQLGGSAGSMCGGVPCSLTPVQVSGLSGVTAIAAGRYHSLALKGDGSVWAWGRNTNGQLGNNSTTNSPTPVQVLGPNGVGTLTGITALAGGGAHSLARRNDGTLWAWGGNGEGQLGNNSTTDSLTPVEVLGPGGAGFLTSVTTIAAGNDHSMAIRSGTPTTLWAWGRAGEGQLGNGCTLGATCTSQLTPVQVVGPGGSGTLTGVTALAAGTIHSLAAKGDGTAWAWGDGTFGKLGNPAGASSSSPVQVSDLTGVAEVAAGFGHSLARKSDGGVWAWGLNSSGQLGTALPLTTCGSLAQPCSPYPVQVRAPGGVGWLTGVSQIAAGREHSLALTPTLASVSASPKSVPAGRSITVSWAGITNSSALDWIGLFAPGAADGASVARQNTTGAASGSVPFAVPPGLTPGLYQFRLFANNSFTRLAVGDVFTVTAPVGAPYTWGLNDRGQLGDNTTTNRALPVAVSGLAEATSPAGGFAHSLALRPDGTVWAWGSNQYGQLGGSAGSMCGGVPCSLTPVQVSGLSSVAAVAAGREHSLALLNNGTVMAWGRNANGQLGNGCTIGTNCNNSSMPMQVVGPSGAGALGDVVAIAAGGAHSLAVRADGGVWAWGSNGSGQLGTGCDFGTGCPDSSVPVQVRGVGGTGFLTAVVALAGGGDHSLALKLDGTAWAWGFNSDGQLGNGCLLGSTCNDRTSPVQVVNLSGGTALGAGTNHSLALLAGGSPRAWGLGGQGQLGTGTNGSSSTPASPLGLSGVAALAGGGFHSLALRSDNTAWAWGAGTSGELGNGGMASSNTPVPVSLPRAVAVAGGGFHSLGAQASPTPAPSATPTPTATRTPSPTATRTPTPSPTATGTTCPGQGRVAVEAVPADGGRLRVTVTVQGTGNGIQSLQFAGPSAQIPSPNAQIEDAQGGLHTLPTTLALTGQPTSYTFYVRRATGGQATTVAFTVVDNCGAWPTLVGGGPSAF